MILVRSMGGLGNQMFQYAFGYCLAKKNETILKIDDTLLLDRSQPHEIVTHRTLDLTDVFDIRINMASEKEVEYFNGKTKYSSFADKIINSIVWRLRRRHLIIEKNRKFDKYLLNTSDNKCLVGAWQSEKYFKEISGEIKSIFKFKQPVLFQSQKLEEDIISKNSVCLHIRRGDYVSSKLYSNVIGALDLSYYSKAIELVSQKLSAPCFYIFSDDLKWCKENLLISEDHVFVEDEHVGFKAGNYLQLMTLCKNFIISNSTFSWWAAWIGEKSESMVVGPINWFKDSNFDSSDILPEHWVKL